MVIDTHIHERQHSPDSRADIFGIVRQARSVGLDGVCITNHDDHQIRAVARELSRQLDFLIIPGCEVLTYQGDVIVFGVEQLPGEKVHARELVDYVNSCGGVAIAAHPFRSNNRGLGKLIAEIPGLSGAEGFNGNTCLAENLLTCELAAQCGLPLFGILSPRPILSRRSKPGSRSRLFSAPNAKAIGWFPGLTIYDKKIPF